MLPTLIKHVRIFDGISLLHQTGNVLIDGGRIVSVTENAPSGISEHTEIIDGTGKTLLPGLIDCHVHAGSDPEDLNQPLRFGITTVLDMHNDPKAVARLTSAARSSSTISDFRSACHAATIEGGWPAPILEAMRKKDDGHGHNHENHSFSHISSENDVKEFVKKNVSNGCSYIKLMQESGANFSENFPTPTLSLQSAVVREAHDYNLLAVGHATSVADALILLKAGVDGLVHIPHDIPPTPELVAKFVALSRSNSESRHRKTFVTPTLTAFCSGTGSNDSTLAFISDTRVQGRLSPASAAKMSSTISFPNYIGSISNAYAWVRALKDTGEIDIILGTDAAPFVPGVGMGPSAIQELELYVEECGFSGEEALRAATGMAAACFGLEDRGLVKVGGRADLFLVDGDATADIRALRVLEAVWKAGVRL